MRQEGEGEGEERRRWTSLSAPPFPQEGRGGIPPKDPPKGEREGEGAIDERERGRERDARFALT